MFAQLKYGTNLPRLMLYGEDMVRISLRVSSFVLVMFIGLTASPAAKLQAQSSPPASAPAPDSPLRASPDHLPTCKYAPPPPYTKEARKAKYEGIVVVEAIIELDGKLSNMRVIKSPGLGLDHSALETLKKWKCTPATGPNGKPVRTSVPIEISFRLGPGA